MNRKLIDLKTKNKLLSGILEITHRCNLKCLHCYLLIDRPY